MGIFKIARWNGVAWKGVGHGVRGSTADVNKMSVFRDELVVAGRFSKSDDPENPGENIAKWDGVKWTELGEGVDDAVWDIRVYDDNLYSCGFFMHAGGINAGQIARWDGANWCGLGTSFDIPLTSLEFYRDTLYVGGGFGTVNGDSIGRVAKWIGGSYIDTCGNTSVLSI